jgi:hypothetical protein
MLVFKQLFTFCKAHFSIKKLRNGTARFKKCKQLLEYQISFYLETCCGQNPNLYLIVVHFFNVSGSLRKLFSCVGVLILIMTDSIEQHVLKNVNYCWNTNISFYLETSGGQNPGLYLICVHFFNVSFNKTSVAA